jgi:hypothetical protein
MQSQISFSSSLNDKLLIKKEHLGTTIENISKLNKDIQERENCRDSHRVTSHQRDLEKSRDSLLYIKIELSETTKQLEKLKCICDNPPSEQINNLTICFNELSDEYKKTYEQWENAYDMWKQNEKKHKIFNMKMSYIYEIEHEKFKEYNAEFQKAFQGCMIYENRCRQLDALLQAYNDIRRFIFKHMETTH